MKTDAQLKKDVEAELDWEPAVNAARVGVEVKAGVVTLSGHLDSYPEKWAAEHAALRVADVKGVAVEIDVKPVGAFSHSDSEIAAAAIDHLRWSVSVPRDQVKVKVEGGWVTLSGTLDWEYQRRDAAAAVRILAGVKGVSNLIELKKKPLPSDVKVKIEAALQRAAHVDAEHITVSVANGKVTLGGTVHTSMERQLATDAAWAAPGVLQVVDHMHFG